MCKLIVTLFIIIVIVFIMKVDFLKLLGIVNILNWNKVIVLLKSFLVYRNHPYNYRKSKFYLLILKVCF